MVLFQFMNSRKKLKEGFRGAVVVTSALHAEGPGIEPQRNQFFNFSTKSLSVNKKLMGTSDAFSFYIVFL